MNVTLVDAHVHFWDPARLRYPWLDAMREIAAAHRPAQWAEDFAGVRVERAVFVQAECAPEQGRDEVAWVAGLVAAEPRIAGIVAFAPLDRGERTIAALAELAREPLVRGVRHQLQGETAPDFCLRPEFVAGVRALAARGWTFDICCRSDQLPAVAELVRRCPETTFVLDHAAKPDIARGRLAPWRSDLAALAAESNVVCKLSGLVTEADHVRWTVADLRPFVDHLLATFGPARLLFGSDWPVVKLAGGARRWFDAVLSLLDSLTSAERDAILRANATRIYRLA